MILSFSIENWMSYQDEATLSMVGTLERQHKSTLAKLPGWRSKYVLPIGAIYGGNASGKTAVFKALAALREMALEDPGVSGLLPIDPFRLREGTTLRPTCLDLTFLAGGRVYRLVVEATLDQVSYESLELITEKSTRLVYERSHEGYEFDGSFFSDIEHVRYAAKSTRGNRLFLGSAVSQNVSELNGAFEWFSETLEMVGVGSHAFSFATAAGTQEGFLEFASRTLTALDTGIVRLTGEEVSMDLIPKNRRLADDLATLAEDEVLTLVLEREAGDYGFEAFTIRRGRRGLEAQRLRTVHLGPDGNEHTFALSSEPSGTQRLMGLLPMLFDLTRSGGEAVERVYVVDELDRCLHTMLTRRLVEDFLSGCSSNTRKQLLFTTHDLLLMDQSLIRRDEMYITERSALGESHLVGLSEYDGIRYDKDLVRSYLDGRFGGIPMLREVADAQEEE